jgi:hypothetical protein
VARGTIPPISTAGIGRLAVLSLLAFGGIASGCAGFSNRLAEWLLLRDVYGADRVARENLRVVGYKPLEISNGDRFPPGPAPYEVVRFIGFGGGTIVLAAAFGLLLPRQCRRALAGQLRPTAEVHPAGWAMAVITGAALFYLNTGTDLWFAPLLSAAVVLAALATCWVNFAEAARPMT